MSGADTRILLCHSPARRVHQIHMQRGEAGAEFPAMVYAPGRENLGAVIVRIRQILHNLGKDFVRRSLARREEWILRLEGLQVAVKAQEHGTIDRQAWMNLRA